jgi:hypothetical protein
MLRVTAASKRPAMAGRKTRSRDSDAWMFRPGGGLAREFRRVRRVLTPGANYSGPRVVVVRPGIPSRGTIDSWLE